MTFGVAELVSDVIYEIPLSSPHKAREPEGPERWER